MYEINSENIARKIIANKVLKNDGTLLYVARSQRGSTLATPLERNCKTKQPSTGRLSPTSEAGSGVARFFLGPAVFSAAS
jgi:hypothetical protein